MDRDQLDMNGEVGAPADLTMALLSALPVLLPTPYLAPADLSRICTTCVFINNFVTSKPQDHIWHAWSKAQWCVSPAFDGYHMCWRDVVLDLIPRSALAMNYGTLIVHRSMGMAPFLRPLHVTSALSPSHGIEHALHGFSRAHYCSEQFADADAQPSVQFAVSAACMLTAIFITFHSNGLNAIFSCKFLRVSCSTSAAAATNGDCFFTSAPLAALHSRKIQRFDLGLPVMCQRGDVMTVEFLDLASFSVDAAGVVRNRPAGNIPSRRFWAVGIKQLVPEAEYLKAMSMCLKEQSKVQSPAESISPENGPVAELELSEWRHREPRILRLTVTDIETLLTAALAHRRVYHQHDAGVQPALQLTVQLWPYGGRQVPTSLLHIHQFLFCLSIHPLYVHLPINFLRSYHWTRLLLDFC
jgi:hypothetical protein